MMDSPDPMVPFRTMVELDRLRAENKAQRELLFCLVDSDPCQLDHNGGCQAHGFIFLNPGERCPHERTKKLIDWDGTF
jgi:hypothetical protein